MLLQHFDSIFSSSHLIKFFLDSFYNIRMLTDTYTLFHIDQNVSLCSFELTFGVLVAMAFVPRAPVGRLFYRLMGTVALVPALIGLVPPLLYGEAQWSDPRILAGALVLLAYPIYSGPVRGLRWGVALAVAIANLFAAVAMFAYLLRRHPNARLSLIQAWRT